MVSEIMRLADAYAEAEKRDYLTGEGSAEEARAALEAALDTLTAELTNTRQALGIAKAAAKILANPSAYGLETD